MDSEKGRQEMNLCDNNTSNALDALADAYKGRSNALEHQTKWDRMMLHLAELQLTYSPDWGANGQGDQKLYDFVTGLIEEFEGWDEGKTDSAQPKRGKWIKKHRHYGGFRSYTGFDAMGEQHTVTVDERAEYDDLYCPKCGARSADNFLNFCPNCGADMREVTE